ncbi:MAG: hypothetical protein HQK89_11025 [Nitrospirae bacterium]|nr:hypothetical protein [Nitrospirota bacterium]
MLIPVLIAIHVIAVVIWIGGVSFVTVVVFPMILRMEDSMEKVLFFQGTEHRFARIAKACVVVVGLTGGGLLQLTGEWKNLFTKAGIGPTVMLLVWCFYVLVLLFEKNLFKVMFKGEAQHDTRRVFVRLTGFHWVVMGLSLMAVGIGVYTGHAGGF